MVIDLYHKEKMEYQVMSKPDTEIDELWQLAKNIWHDNTYVLDEPEMKEFIAAIQAHYARQEAGNNRTAEMAGALKARDVINAEMGVDSHATGAYLIDRYHELKSQLTSQAEQERKDV